MLAALAVLPLGVVYLCFRAGEIGNGLFVLAVEAGAVYLFIKYTIFVVYVRYYYFFAFSCSLNLLIISLIFSCSLVLVHDLSSLISCNSLYKGIAKNELLSFSKRSMIQGMIFFPIDTSSLNCGNVVYV